MKIEVRNEKHENLLFIDCEYDKENIKQFAAILFRKSENNLYELRGSLNMYIKDDTMLKILNKYDINTPYALKTHDSIEIFDFYKQLYKDDLIPKESINQTHRESLEKYMSEYIVSIK